MSLAPPVQTGKANNPDFLGAFNFYCHLQLVWKDAGDNGYSSLYAHCPCETLVFFFCVIACLSKRHLIGMVFEVA